MFSFHFFCRELSCCVFRYFHLYFSPPYAHRLRRHFIAPHADKKSVELFDDFTCSNPRDFGESGRKRRGKKLCRFDNWLEQTRKTSLWLRWMSGWAVCRRRWEREMKWTRLLDRFSHFSRVSQNVCNIGPERASETLTMMLWKKFNTYFIDLFFTLRIKSRPNNTLFGYVKTIGNKSCYILSIACAPLEWKMKLFSELFSTRASTLPRGIIQKSISQLCGRFGARVDQVTLPIKLSSALVVLSTLHIIFSVILFTFIFSYSYYFILLSSTSVDTEVSFFFNQLP